jgi:hypothetical protein
MIPLVKRHLTAQARVWLQIPPEDQQLQQQPKVMAKKLILGHRVIATVAHLAPTTNSRPYIQQ